MTIKAPPTEQWEEGGGGLSSYQPGPRWGGGGGAGIRQSKTVKAGIQVLARLTYNDIIKTGLPTIL